MIRRNWSLPFAGIAAIGLVASLVVHVCALLGMPDPLCPASSCVQGGVYAVWIAAVIAANRVSREPHTKDFWKDTLSGCPSWMKMLTVGFLVYDVVNFIVVIILSKGHGASNHNELQAEREFLRVFSGHWMACYSAAMAVLYSFWNQGLPDRGDVCPNGHPVPPGSKFCPECGQKTFPGASINP